MDELYFYLQNEKSNRAYEDYFGFADRHPDDLDGIDELMPTEEQFNTFMNALKAVSPAPIYFVEMPDNRNGVYGHWENEINISWRISPVMAFRSALHEMAHAILHPWPGGAKPETELPRAARETEAEGVAYLVCMNYGLDVGAYSLDYIQSWIRHLTPDEAEWSLALAERTAKRIVAAIDAELEKQSLEHSSGVRAKARTSEEYRD